MKTKPVYSISVEDENGNIVEQIPMTLADDDWLRAGRLREKAKKGDKKAAKELKKMENALMVSISKEKIHQYKKDSNDNP